MGDWSVDANSGIAVVRWLDNSSVQLSSSHTAVEPETTIRRLDRKQHKYADIPCPAIIKENNENMGVVDLFDMLMALYKVDHKSPKWYRRVFLWGLNLAVINSWLRHADQNNTKCNVTKTRAFEFAGRDSDVMMMIQEHKLPPELTKKRGRPPLVPTTALSASETDEDQSNRSKKRMVRRWSL